MDNPSDKPNKNEFLEEANQQSLPSESSNDEENFYRKSAIDNYRVPHDLDILFLPIRLKNQFAWYALMSLCFIGLVWLFFGSIPIVINGAGIVMNHEGVFTIQSKNSGVVDAIFVRPGELVQKGQLIARVYDPQQIFKYEASLIKVKKLADDVAKLKNQIHLELEAQKQSLLEQIKANEATIKELQMSLPPLEEELKTKKRLYQEQLISLKQVHDTEQLLSQRRVAIEITLGNLADLKANLTRSYREQELREKEGVYLLYNSTYSF